jgi:hypothetical protein
LPTVWQPPAWDKLSGSYHPCRSDPVGADWTTLPGNFKRNGYFTTGTGKTFRAPRGPFFKMWSLNRASQSKRSCGSQTPVTRTSLTTPTPGPSTSTRTASAGARPRGTPTGGTRRATTSGATTRPSPAPMARPAAPTPSRSKAARSGARSIRPSCRSSRTGRSSSSGIRQRWRRRARSHCRCVTAHLLHTRFTKRIGASMII